MNRSYLLGLLAIAILSLGLKNLGCGPKTVSTVNHLDDYSKALDQCKLEGKDAGQVSVFEECAKRVDIKFGKKDEK